MLLFMEQENTQNIQQNNQQTNQQQKQQQMSLEDKLIEMRQEWTKKVEELNMAMKMINEKVVEEITALRKERKIDAN